MIMFNYFKDFRYSIDFSFQEKTLEDEEEEEVKIINILPDESLIQEDKEKNSTDISDFSKFFHHVYMFHKHLQCTWGSREGGS